MATIEVKIINPYRCRNLNLDIDYNNRFPFEDYEDLQEQYQRGVYPSGYVGDWVLGKKIGFQVVLNTSLAGFTQRVITPSGIKAVTRTNITPADWVSGQLIILLEYTPTEEGLHYIEFTRNSNNTIYRFDPVYVTSNSDKLKELVEIKYRYSQNRRGGVFYNSSGTALWQGLGYYTGLLDDVGSDNEQTLFEDAGDTIVTNSVVKDTRTLKINDIHKNNYKVINNICQCDELYVNGQLWTATEISPEKINDNSDLVNIIIKLTRREYDFNYIL